ncbi:MAG: cation transporter [Flavobacteriales bacterium]|nr:cation transporter [Flavobacteriales bacterium]
MAAKDRNITLQATVLAVGCLLMALKFVGWRITHSNAVLSDALESIANVAAGSFALYSLALAAKPKDREHPYGHGKVEFISAALEGVLVAIAGVLIIVRAVEALIHGVQVHNLGKGILLVGISAVANGIMGWVLRARGKRLHSPTMEAGGVHLLSDTWTTAALILGLLVIEFTGVLWLDSLLAIGFALFIMWQGLRLVRRSIGGIMDETDMAVAGAMVQILDQHRRDAWIDLHNFRVIKFGSTLHIDCHVTLPWYFTLEAGHREITALDQLVNQRSGREVEFFIHTDPCIPASCPVCQVEDCPVRQAPFVKRVPWTMATVLTDRKHGLEAASAALGQAR